MDPSILSRLIESLSENRLVLPAFPEAALAARNAASSEAASAIAVAREVAKDPVLAARILKVANSSLFGFSFNTSSLQQAISRVGLEHTKTLVTNFALMQLMNPPKGIYGEHIKTIRSHSIDVASVSYVLAEKGRTINPNKALLGGMLHDIGYLPLIQFVKNESESSLADPNFLLGLREFHGQAGNLLLMYWQFAPELVEVVTAHEVLSAELNSTVTLRDVVALANAWVNAIDESQQAYLMESPLAQKLNVRCFNGDELERIKEVKRFFH